MKEEDYKEVLVADISEHFKSDIVLVVTATDLETDNLHLKISPLNGQDKILKFYNGKFTYYLGVFGKYKIVHVQCGMGSVSRDSSIMTITEALNTTKAKMVVMVGIAFGVDDSKQNIGDVLISESVVPYNSKRIGKNKTIQRGIESQPSQVLLNRLKNIRTWEHFIDENTKAKLIFTRLLSGEELVDNLDYRNELAEIFPDSKGGEMEGAGVYAACGDKVDWILIKGICDFADGEKSKDKIKRQTIAVDSALSICLELFSSLSAFKEIGVSPLEELEKKNEFFQSDNVNDALFALYDISKESYYIEKESDGVFNQLINQYSVWVFGNSGCGKSNMIVRNLSQSDKEYISVNLAPCIGDKVENLFYEIFYELSAKLNGENSKVQPQNFSECIKELIKLFEKYYNDKELIIFIDEIPISSCELQKEFTEKFISLVISKNFKIGLNQIKFVLSSIENPKKHIPLIQQKIHQTMDFMELEYWSNEDITKLVTCIQDALNSSLDEKITTKLIARSKGSPRFIKKFYRSIYTLEKNDTATCEYIMSEIEKDLR